MERKNKIILISTTITAVAVAIGIGSYFIIKNNKSTAAATTASVNLDGDQTDNDKPDEATAVPEAPKEKDTPIQTVDSNETEIANEIKAKQEAFATKIKAIQDEVNARPLDEQKWSWSKLQTASTMMSSVKERSEFIALKNHLEITKISADDHAGKITLQVTDQSDKSLFGQIVWKDYLSNQIRSTNSNLMKFLMLSNTTDDKIAIDDETYEKWVNIAKKGNDFGSEFYKFFITSRLTPMVISSSLKFSREKLTLNLYIPQSAYPFSNYKEYQSFEITNESI